MKRVLGDRLTTVFVRQGHYADEAAGQAFDPAPDLAIDDIGALATFDLQQFGPRACRQSAPGGPTEFDPHRRNRHDPPATPAPHRPDPLAGQNTPRDPPRRHTTDPTTKIQNNP